MKYRIIFGIHSKVSNHKMPEKKKRVEDQILKIMYYGSQKHHMIESNSTACKQQVISISTFLNERIHNKHFALCCFCFAVYFLARRPLSPITRKNIYFFKSGIKYLTILCACVVYSR